VRSVGATDLPTKETNTACTHTQTNAGKEKRAVHLPEIKQIFSKILGKCVGRTSNVGELLQRVHTHCAAEGWAGQYIQEKIKKPTKRRWITRYLALHAANRMGEADHVMPLVPTKRGRKSVFTPEVSACGCKWGSGLWMIVPFQ
jgi:hypothetical protein